MKEPGRQISEERKTLYYIGSAVQILGLLIFLSTFVTAVIATPGPGSFTAFGLQGIGGFIVVLIGTAVRNIGAKGLAGSGAILDPERARQDIEPWSRMAGGVVEDALSEVKGLGTISSHGGAEVPRVKVRCRACHALNDEDAKFCNQCGLAL